MNFNLLDFFRSTNYEIKNFPEFRERFRFYSIQTLRFNNFQTDLDRSQNFKIRKKMAKCQTSQNYMKFQIE